MNAYIRFKLALTETDPTVKPYDEAAWAETADVRETPIEVSLALLENLHARWVILLRSMSDADFKKQFVHPEIGVVSLEKNLALYAWHGKHHVAHITSLARAQAMAVKARARELGIVVGTLPTGPLNAITDVAGVRVGHATLNRGENVRTGVTAILPHSGNLFHEKVPGAVFVGNAFGKLVGSTQVNELGEIETPILLTSTLNVFRVADALIDYMLSLDGNAQVRSINPLVGETNDGVLNDVQGRHSGHNEVFAALQSAKSGAIEEGCVGAGTGTIAFGWKGGIGTSSRKAGDYTVGVLVQSNFGGRLTILGVPIERTRTIVAYAPHVTADGSIMMIVATDAPVDARNLHRLGARTMMGLGRTGAAGSNGSGDYAIAFTTSRKTDLLSNDAVSALFPAVIEATEEAIYNSLFRAETTTGNGRTVEALPVQSTVETLRKHGMIKQN